MAMKKVGGPARKEMRSRATNSSACSGSKRRTRTERRPAAPGTRTPLSSPEMWAIGAGISTASAGPRPCTRAINEAFQLRPRCVCSTALGTPVEPEVNRTRATSEGWLGKAPEGTGAPPSASASAAGSENDLGSELQDQGGVDLVEGRFHVRRAERVQDGRRHGTDAPAGPGQDGGRQAVGDLPRHGLAAPDTSLPQAARDRGHERIGLGRREPRGTVDHLSAVRGEQGVQGGHVPGAAGPAVAAGLLGYPGRSEAGRHGRAPYLGAALPMNPGVPTNRGLVRGDLRGLGTTGPSSLSDASRFVYLDFTMPPYEESGPHGVLSPMDRHLARGRGAARSAGPLRRPRALWCSAATLADVPNEARCGLCLGRMGPQEGATL